MRRSTTLALLILALVCLTFTFLARAQSEQVVFPSAEVAFIVGPQIKAGSITWYDQNAITKGLALCSEFPAVPPGNVLARGTITLTQGSKIVSGTGTAFRAEAPNNSYFLIASNGTYRQPLFIAGTPQSDTQLTLNAAWSFPTVTEQYSIGFADEVDNFAGYKNYYDFGLVAYTNYYRTGDDRFLQCARKVTDSWWSSYTIDSGRSTSYEGGEGFSPRMAALSGLMLRALDGRPEMWPWITGYIRNQFGLWVTRPTVWAETDPNFNTFYFGVRDGGYMLLYAANLAGGHPDPTVRQEFKDKVLRSAKNYYAKNQSADGSYRWDDDAAFVRSEQPFQVGLLNEAMIQVHRLTNDATVRNAIIKSAEHEYQFSYNRNGWRGLYYLIHGNWKNPDGTLGPSCETGCGAAANPWPPADVSQVAEVRQLNGTAIHVFGYAYLLTGDQKFKTWGDDMFDATFSGADGFRALANFRGKEYNECYRSSGRYLAWRAGGSIPSPSPTPTPAPTPTPTPAPTPTPVPSPSPSPSPIRITKDWTWPSGQTARRALLADVAKQGWEDCFVTGSYLYCSRAQ